MLCICLQSLVVSEAEFPANNNNNPDKLSWQARQEGMSSVTTLTHRGLITARPSDGGVTRVGRAAGWAVSFDRLLKDKAGLATFTVSYI